jgi:Ca2+/Na+ antiporter
MVTEKMYNTMLFSVAVLLLAMTLMINPTYYMCILLLSVILCFYTLLTIHYKRNKIIEKNTQNTDVKTQYYDEEDIEQISHLNDQTELKLYYTIFNSESVRLRSPSYHWYNISKYIPTTCGTEELNIRFENIISGKPRMGIICNNNTGKGPLSSNLGTGEMTETFTIFTTLRFDIPELDPSNTELINMPNIIKMYANNPSNNGLSLSIINVGKVTQNNSFKGSIEVKIGENSTCVLQDYDFNNTRPYLITVTKTTNNISVSIVSDIDSSDYVENISENITQAETAENNRHVLHLSNKAMEINPFFGNIYNLGFYNNNIVNTHLMTLINHINAQFLKYNVRYQEKEKQIKDAEQTMIEMKSCKYDEDTCNKCSEITDWTNMKQIINANKECRDAINLFCSKSENVGHDLCFCWDPSKNETPSCIAYKQIYTDTVAGNKSLKCDIDKLLADKESELYAKLQKMNLCDCKSSDKSRKNDVPLVQMIDNAYDLNKPDIDIYNDILI